MNPNEPKQSPSSPDIPAVIPVQRAPAPESVAPPAIASDPASQPSTPPVPTPSPPPTNAPPSTNTTYSMGSLEAKQANHRTRQLIALAAITIALVVIGSGVVWTLRSRQDNHTTHPDTPGHTSTESVDSAAH